MKDTRTKEELKRDGDYTPAYWRALKAERGWLLVKHGQPRPPKWRACNHTKRTTIKARGVTKRSR